MRLLIWTNKKKSFPSFWKALFYQYLRAFGANKISSAHKIIKAKGTKILRPNTVVIRLSIGLTQVKLSKSSTAMIMIPTVLWMMMLCL